MLWIKRFFYLFVVVLIFFSSCSVAKRKYTGGLYVEWNHSKKHSGQKKVSSELDLKDIEKIPVQSLNAKVDNSLMVSEKKISEEKNKPFKESSPSKKKTKARRSTLSFEKLKSKSHTAQTDGCNDVFDVWKKVFWIVIILLVLAGITALLTSTGAWWSLFVPFFAALLFVFLFYVVISKTISSDTPSHKNKTKGIFK